MSIIAWKCAFAEPAPVVLTTAEASSLGKVDSNKVTIVGEGEITTLGPSPMAMVAARFNEKSNEVEPILEAVCCTKRILFKPEPTIVLVNASGLMLLGGGNRLIQNPSVGIYSCDAKGNWFEESFTDTTITTEMLVEAIRKLTERVQRLESRRVP